MKIPQNLLTNPTAQAYWDTSHFHDVYQTSGESQSQRSTERWLKESGLLPEPIGLDQLCDPQSRPIQHNIASHFDTRLRKKSYLSLVVQYYESALGVNSLVATDARGGRRWVYLEALDQDSVMMALLKIGNERNVIFWPSAELHDICHALVEQNASHTFSNEKTKLMLGMFAFREVAPNARNYQKQHKKEHRSHLDALEAESIHIMREVIAQAENPVMLYSIGKDSAVMLRLAQKAFAPSKPPFPLLHVDTRWKFQAMYEFREKVAAETGMDLLVHINPEGIEKDINPFDHGSELHTHIMKTEGLKQALDLHKFDVAFGGARRDEEKSRAKERIFSFRSATHQWDPKNQRPELWNIYNGYKAPKESIRVFPLSNWTEQDIWEYIYRENIDIVPLYFAKERPVVMRDGTWFLVDDERFRLTEAEKIELKTVRFRTLGCYPLTGAFESKADDIESIVLEVLTSRTSERQGRKIDTDSAASMEKKKVEGYF